MVIFILEKETVSKRRIVGMKLTEQNTHFDTDVIDPNTIVPSHWIAVNISLTA